MPLRIFDAGLFRFFRMAYAVDGHAHTCRLMQDNDPKDTSGLAKDYPPESADMNPIESFGINGKVSSRSP